MAKEPAPREERASASPQYADDKSYSVKLRRPIEFPKGSRNFLTPDAKVTLRGDIAKQFAADISEAVEVKQS